MLKSQEYSKQICLFAKNSSIGNHRLESVSELLLTLLMDATSIVATQEEFPLITKKIRDEICGEKCDIFQRSSFYVSVKAMLQHSFTMQNPGAGKTFYKIFMLKFLIGTCAPYKEHMTFDIDLISQAIAKLARRIEKLSKIEIIPVELIDLYSSTIDEAKDTIKKIREKIDAQIEKKQKDDEKDAELPKLTNLNFASDICYKSPKLQNYLKERAQEQNNHQTSTGFKFSDFTSYKLYFNNALIPERSTISQVKDGIEKRLFWMSFENEILYETKVDDNRWTCVDLRFWSFAYADFAENNYKECPLFISRMLLVRLKIIMVLDKKAIDQHELLNEYKSGINPDIINCLLLPQSKDMQIAYEIEQYFRRRNERSSFPSIIEEDFIENGSFSVRFAENDLKNNERMKEIRKKILEKDEKNVNNKMAEWNRLIKEVEERRNEAISMKCDYTSQCKHCEKNEQAIRTIKPYERLWPEDNTEQLAILFELNIPEVIACLRDVSCRFLVYFEEKSEPLTIRNNWFEFISNIFPNLDEFPPYKSEYVKLGSRYKQILKKIRVVEGALEKLIIENTSECIFYVDKKPTIKQYNYRLPWLKVSIDKIKKECTLNIQDEYADLQWALSSTKHTENEVLSTVYECGIDMTLSTYRNFGLLRSDGDRMQSWKLFVMIKNETLPFEKEGVFLLMMQTLWECEVSGEDGFVRESHIDFDDKQFCGEMIKQLDNFVKQQEDNWKQPFKLLTITLIAVRMFEINKDEELAKRIVQILRDVRRIALKWIKEIDKIIERDLRLKLIYVAIMGGMTFFVHPKHKYYVNIFQNQAESKKAIESWLKLIISLNINVRLYTNDEKHFSSNLRMFLRLMEQVGASLEKKVREVIEQDLEEKENEVIEVNSNFIANIIKTQWQEGNIDNIHFNEDFPHIIVAEATVNSINHIVTIDIITGTFLVDNLPMSRLPKQVTDSDIYRWFFEDAVFEVQPDAQGNFSFKMHDNCRYKIKKVNENKITITEIIAEQKDNGQKEIKHKELIDKNIFTDDFPYTLVNDYSHWWNKDENCIEFRRRTFDKMHFSNESIEYKLNMNGEQKLIHLQTKRTMLHVKSQSYKKITRQLSRLEHPNYIHVFSNTNNHVATAELLRMNLKFTIKYSKTSQRPCYLTSDEFNGMRVIREQQIGTLFNCGLVLESEDKQNKIVLVPNGKIEVKKKNQFASVSINTNGDLQSPPYYQYQVDKYCRQLKCKDFSEASWFFLAYLHAVTSHGETEPFTGMSGTERAVQILQSAFAQLSSPYKPEAVKILQQIAKLSPIRRIHKDIQTVNWPKNIPTRSAQDCFVLITTKLLKDSQRLRNLHEKSSDNKINHNTDLKLNKRDHYRCQQLNPNLCISNTFLGNELKTAQPLQNQHSFSKSYKKPHVTRTVCNFYHLQQCKKFNDIEVQKLQKFLTGEMAKTLEGIGDGDRVKELLDHNVIDDIRNLWISLYDAAINEKFNREEFAIILSIFAHREDNPYAILALQVIATNASEFRNIKPPTVATFQLTDTFQKSNVCDLLKKCYKQKQQNKCNKNINRLASEIMKKRCKSIESIDLPAGFEENIDNINEQMEIWHANDELEHFIRNVGIKLKSLVGIEPENMNPCLTPAPTTPRVVNSITFNSTYFEAKILKNLSTFKQEMELAEGIWKHKRESSLSSDDWMNICKKIQYSDETYHLIEAGIFPRLVPSLILPKIMDKNTDEKLKCIIGAFAISITREQRKNRIKDGLETDNESKPHDNWSPCEYPQWLLFEIEQNLTIRSIQIEIAKQMMVPIPNEPGAKINHFVMQLNMGEGKTSVIVPLLASVLANGTHTCEIIVLKSLFYRNLKTLRQQLGGLLNMRIYRLVSIKICYKL